MKKIIRLLTTQGATNADVIFKSLLAAGIVTEDATAKNITALLIGVTVPDQVELVNYVTERLTATNEFGDNFADTFVQALNIDPSRPKLSQVAICHHTPWVRVSGIGGERAEFTGAELKSRAVRTESVISGGLISAINMKLKFQEPVGGCSGNTGSN